MVAVGLPGGAVGRIRFAVSCLWEVVAAIRVLRDPGRHAVHLPWANRVRPRIAGVGLLRDAGLPRDAGLLWDLVPREPAYLPDFLTPAPSGLTGDLPAELAALRATPADVVRAQLDLYPNPPPGLYADPAAGLRRLADEIAAFWAVAIAPDWPRIQLLLDAEVFARGRRLAEDGAAAMLNDLHESVRFDRETLSVTKRYCTADDVPEGSGLVLIPSVFVWPTVLSVFAGDVPQLAYPARGVATLWETGRSTPEALGALVGRGRAGLLAEMGAPVSTTDLARRTGMTAGGVSQHLAVLRAAGLVVTHRRGRAVLNTRTSLAEALLAQGPVPAQDSVQALSAAGKRPVAR
jgi:DNA-binding transcriptional ArsR family regulator